MTRWWRPEGDATLGVPRKETRERIARTLEARPWQACGCAICARWGVDVVIFRGNDRNRRRGLHNTYVFYQRLQRDLAPDSVRFQPDGAVGYDSELEQYELFAPPAEELAG
jgi:hypothetical protein